MINGLRTISILLTASILLASCSVFNKSSETDTPNRNKPKTDTEFMYDAHFLEALRLKMLGKFEQAAMELEKARQYIDDEAVLYFQLAEMNSMMGSYAIAQEHAKKAIELDNDNIWYHILLARLYQNAGLFADAAETMERIIELEPGKLEYYFMLSTLYQSIGEPKEAIRTMDEAEAYFGITDVVSIEKERLYRKMEKPGKALKEVKKLTEAFPGNPKYKAILAELHIAQGSQDKAKEIYDELEESDNLDGSILLSISEFYRQNNEYEKAFDYLKKAFASEEMNIDMKIEMLVSMLTNTGTSAFETEKQRELFDILIYTHPENPKALTVYSDFLVKIGEFKEAVDIIKGVLKTTRDKYLIWEQMLYLNNQLGDYEAMYNYCDTITSLFPNQPLPYLYGAVSAFQLEKTDRTIEYARSGLRYTFDNKPVKAELLTFLGEAYHKKEEYNKADSAFDEVLNIDPDNTFVLNNYAYYLSTREEKLDKARKLGEKLVELVPENPSYLDTYGWVLYQHGEYEKALGYIRDAYQLSKDRAVIVEHYGDVLYKTGDKEQALEKWKEALEIDAGNKKLQEKIESKNLNEE